MMKNYRKAVLKDIKSLVGQIIDEKLKEMEKKTDLATALFYRHFSSDLSIKVRISML